MELQEALTEITSSLKAWKAKGLNEAQTSQAIVLRVLYALGYDIWNPFEVVPQEASNGSIPDYIVNVQNKRRFVVEVKKLSLVVDDRAKTQAVSYASNQAIRWALLTNGSDWYLFDSFMHRQVAHQRLILHLSLNEQEVPLLAQYFERLFGKAAWNQKDPDAQLEKSAKEFQQNIQRDAKLQPIAQKLSEWMNTLRSTEEALKLAYQTNVLDEESKTLIEANKAPFLQFFSQSSAADPEATAPSDNLVDALAKGIEQTKPPKHRPRRRSEGFEAWLNGQPLHATSWRDLHAGIAEAALLFDRNALAEVQAPVYETVDERLKRSGKPYNPESYRRLSNGKYLLLHYSAQDHCRRCRELLKALDAPAGILEVLYKGERYHLP